jgi:amino acid adenylation domain-containing protein
MAERGLKLPPEQEAIRAKCLHPEGVFIGFKKEEIEQSVADRFEQQVGKHGDRLAVQTKHAALTYNELNHAANRMAKAILATRGTGQEPVGLLFENGVQAITAILGVLKAGKFYVPIDPSFPYGRMASILQDSGAELLVTHGQNLRLASDLTGGRLHLIDSDTLDPEVPDENVSIHVSPEESACILYTSGSTGEPKGVIQNQRCLLHWAMIYANDLSITPNDRLTLLHSLSAPACSHHLLGSLLNGASLLPFDPRLGGAAQLARWLRQKQVTIYHSVPVVFRQLAGALTGQETFPCLRAINLSGAPMTKNDVELYKTHFSSESVLLHMIGTTETGWVRRYFIDKGTQIAGNAVPIGYPVEDIEVMLLDEDHCQVSLGEIGEIAVKSRYLGLGYWRKPELTNTKFLRSSNGEEQRIYLTGDLGRMKRNGCLFHLGRKDFQINVRGYRIEIGEIEAALLQHPGIKEAAVVGREVDSGDTRIVAYLVSTGGAPTATQLRRFLKEKLPDYMIPPTFIALSALPLTPNGKLDYRALPTPEGLRPELATSYVAPKTEVEQQIAKVWQEVLRLQKVGLFDNFFDLGGQSVLLTAVQLRLQEVFQRDLSIIEMFKHPTVNALAEYITQKRNQQGGDNPLVNVRAAKNRLKQLYQYRERNRETS